MTKPKNPYQGDTYHQDYWALGYAAGLRDGEKRLARALRRYCKEHGVLSYVVVIIEEFLTARLKRGKK